MYWLVAVTKSLGGGGGGELELLRGKLPPHLNKTLTAWVQMIAKLHSVLGYLCLCTARKKIPFKNPYSA